MNKIPVLVTFFNRPTILEKLFDSIQNQENIELFFASDGARHKNDQNDIDQCWFLVEKYFKKVDSSHKLVRSKNLGCKNAMIGNMDWFFELNEYGIVLEDDCVPNSEFFKVVGGALREISPDSNYISISGSDYLPANLNANTGQFRESIFPQVWGWGSWSRKWELYEPEISDRRIIVDSTSEELYGKEYSLNKRYFNSVFQMRFREIDLGLIDTWDYSLMATTWRHGLKSLQVNGNLVVNSGFGQLATHTTNAAPDWVPKYYSKAIKYEGINPRFDLAADRWTAKNVYNCNVVEVIKNEIKKVVRK
jgi:hypothetical protein